MQHHLDQLLLRCFLQLQSYPRLTYWQILETLWHSESSSLLDIHGCLLYQISKKSFQRFNLYCLHKFCPYPQHPSTNLTEFIFWKQHHRHKIYTGYSYFSQNKGTSEMFKRHVKLTVCDILGHFPEFLTFLDSGACNIVSY